MTAVVAVGNRAQAMWQGVKQVGFDFISLITLILGFLQNCKKPATENARLALIKSAYNKCCANGVSGCIECCMTAKQAAALRKKMAKKQKLKTASLQDAHFFNAISAANVEREQSVKGLTSAYDNDETEDDDEA